MPSFNIIRESTLKSTARVQQVTSMFDVPPTDKITHEWTVDIDLDFDWNVGLIVGESGSGKTTVATELFGELDHSFSWGDNTILDDFPRSMGIKDITALLASVGFSSPPLWLKPFRSLSNGQKFRVEIARLLSEKRDVTVVDEFTSVVDRDVARIASHSVQKAIRRSDRKFVAVSCHYDIIDWLQPDWIYYPTKNIFEKKKITAEAFYISMSREFIRVLGKSSHSIII